MLDFLGNIVASVLILLTLLLGFGTDDFCIQYHDQLCEAYLIFGFIGIILFIIYEIKNY